MMMYNEDEEGLADRENNQVKLLFVVICERLLVDRQENDED